VEWLYYILQAFNSGDLVQYQELCRVHNAALRAQPALVQNEQKLLEKINILCLMEIIFRCIVNYITLLSPVEVYLITLLFSFPIQIDCHCLQSAFRRSNYSLECNCWAYKTFHRECGTSPNEELICKFYRKFLGKHCRKYLVFFATI